MKKNIFLAILLIFLGICVLVGCSAGQSSATSFVQETGSNNAGVVYLMAGKIETAEKVDLQSKTTAKVTEIKVDVGSFVEEGETVIQLDSRDLQAQVAQAQAGVQVAEANLSKIQSGARPEQISQAQAALDSAKANYDNAQSTYDKNKQLLNVGAISQSQLNQFSTSLADAQAAYQTAKAALDLLNKGETAETIHISQAQLQQAQAALEFARTQLDSATIVSPISGFISANNINIGELASVGTPLLTVVNPEALLVNAYLPAVLLSKVKVGQEVIITISGIPDKEYAGEISVIDAAIDSKNANILVKVSFKNQDTQLKPGMFAEVGVRN